MCDPVAFSAATASVCFRTLFYPKRKSRPLSSHSQPPPPATRRPLLSVGLPILDAAQAGSQATGPRVAGPFGWHVRVRPRVAHVRASSSRLNSLLCVDRPRPSLHRGRTRGRVRSGTARAIASESVSERPLQASWTCTEDRNFWVHDNSVLPEEPLLSAATEPVSTPAELDKAPTCHVFLAVYFLSLPFAVVPVTRVGTTGCLITLGSE